MNESEMFDQLAFQGYTKRQLVELVAGELTARKPRSQELPLLPQKADIEKRVAALVARYGNLGGMTRKSFVNEVWQEILRIYRRDAKSKGLSLYLYRG